MNYHFKPVFLKPGKESALRNLHPWLFSGAIAKIDDSIRIGDAVCVFDSRKSPRALGHWCKDAGLVIRLLTFDGNEKFDETFFEKRFLKARDLRTSLRLPNPATTGFRLMHGEGDGLSGLVCDIFDDTAAIGLANPGLRSIIDQLCQFLVNNYAIKNINFFDSEDRINRWLLNSKNSANFLENGYKFIADISEGQKTGHYFDQRNNRSQVARFAGNRRVLDAFCYSGGFSVYAFMGGARHVTSVDISQSAIELCLKNVGINCTNADHKAVISDCFSYLRQIKKDEFDLIILDPPAFSKSAETVMRAARGYKDINLLAMKAVASGGLIFTFSCSQHLSMALFKKIIFAAALDSKREVKILGELMQGADHPVSVYCPESAYLKGLMLYAV